MKSRKLRVAAVGLLAGLMVAAAPLTAAHAATEPPFPEGSDPVWFMDGTDYRRVPAGTQMDWEDLVYIAPKQPPVGPITTLEELESYAFPAGPAETEGYRSFLSLPGDENTPDKWKAYASYSRTTDAAWLVEVKPGSLFQGTPDEVRRNGGTYSLGFAYMKINALYTTKVYYTTINVDPGGNYTFATPQSKQDTSTTLEASATTVNTGMPVTLTARISPTTATGNVVFKNGNTVLSTAASANGVATYTIPSLPAGSHSITAEYAGDSEFSGSTSAAVNITVNSVQGPAESDLTDANKGSVTGPASAPGAVTFNVGAANSGKTVNVWGYPGGIHLG